MRRCPSRRAAQTQKNRGKDVDQLRGKKNGRKGGIYICGRGGGKLSKACSGRTQAPTKSPNGRRFWGEEQKKNLGSFREEKVVHKGGHCRPILQKGNRCDCGNHERKRLCAQGKSGLSWGKKRGIDHLCCKKRRL